MRTYKLSPSLWPKNKYIVIRNHSLLWSGGFVTGTFIALVNAGFTRQAALEIGKASIGLAVIFAILGTALTWWAITKAKRRYDTYELIIADNSIARTQDDMPELTIAKSEILSVQAVIGQGFMVKATDGVGKLWIPDELIGYDEVIAELKTWGLLEQPRTTMPFMNNVPLMLVLSLAAMVALYVGTNPYFVTAVGILLVGFLIYQTIYLLRSPNLPRSSRKMLVFQAFIIVVLVLKVMSVWR